MKQIFLRDRGFTLLELLAVIAIIGLLASYILASIRQARDSAYFSATKQELRSMANALELYNGQYGAYPADSPRDVPPGIEEFLPAGELPTPPWQGSVYDWDNWDDPDTPGKKIYQISVRFCPVGGPLSACNFPNDLWASSFDINSSVYLCVEGACRAHISEPINYPGYCINCN